VERAFWRLIASGVTSEEASAEVGVSTPVGTRWFRHAGGMSPISLAEPSGRYLSFAEREEIALLRAQDHGVREIARRIGRDPSTISRELRRNAATRASRRGYRVGVAQWKAQQAAKRPKPAKITTNPKLREYVEQRLSGAVTGADGRPIPGPNVPWVGRRHGRRQDRRWGTAWSPEQISQRLKVDFPEDESMRISHETIYASLYVQGRGALKRELTACLRTGRALRVPRARTQSRGKNFVTDEVKISQRPAEVADRAVPGHWEGDLIIGLNKSAIGTIVERATRYTMLLHLPPMDGHGMLTPIKNGPPLAGHGAEAVNAAIAAQFATLPEQLRRSLTWDQGSELAQHVQQDRHRTTGLLLRPALALAARQQREHQRPATPVLPQGHRPFPLEHHGPRRGHRHPQQPAAQDTPMAHSRRSLRPAPILVPTSRCCIDPLNLSNISVKPSPKQLPGFTFDNRRVESVHASITRSPNRSTPRSRSNESTEPCTRRESTHAKT
jgi:IS30 family transposase